MRSRSSGSLTFFSSRRRHTRLQGDWSSDVCSSDLEAGKMEMFLENFDIASLIDEVASTMHPMVSKNGNTLHIERAPDLGVMHADQIKEIGRASCRERV